MKKQTKGSVAKRGVSLLLVGVIIFQSFSLVLSFKKVRASEVPVGNVKSVIVQFKGDPVKPGLTESVESQVAEIAQRQQWLAGAMEYSAGYKKLTRSYSQLPYAVFTVDEEGEESLKSNPNVISVTDDAILKPNALDFETLPNVLGGSYQTGFTDGTDDFTGDGFAVAVIDSGVDKTHPDLASAVISEACYGQEYDYSNALVESACPGDALETTAVGSGIPCVTGCSHGTMVAGAVAMQPHPGLAISGDPVNASGVAKGSKIIAIQSSAKVTEKVGQADFCGDAGNSTQVCYTPVVSLVLAGINRVIEINNTNAISIPIAAANVSIGDPSFFTDNEATCSAQRAEFAAINISAATLKAANIATIVAAGNSGDISGNANKVSAPACLSNVIAVSATTANDHMASYSNAGPLTDLVAPGGEADPSAPHTDGGLFLPKPGNVLANQYDTVQGTSFSAPIVAGAWAVIREKAPNASVDGILAGLKSTGVTVTEDRVGYTALAHKRVNVNAALAVADSFAEQPETPVPPVADPGAEVPDSDTWIPGVPNTGMIKVLRSAAIITLSLVLVVLLNRSLLSRSANRRA